MQDFDSMIEYKHAQALEACGFIRCNTFGTLNIFSDKNGECFKAKPDFYNKELNLYIDLKSHPLNSKTSIKAVTNKLQGQLRWVLNYTPEAASTFNHNEASSILWNAGKRHDCLLHAWCHSLYKHKIVQAALSPANYLVVFVNTPKPADAARYKKKGLVWCALSNLHNLGTN